MICKMHKFLNFVILIYLVNGGILFSKKVSEYSSSEEENEELPEDKSDISFFLKDVPEDESRMLFFSEIWIDKTIKFSARSYQETEGFLIQTDKEPNDYSEDDSSRDQTENYTSSSESSTTSDDVIENYQKTFNLFDKDHDGFLTKTDIYHIFKNYDCNWTNYNEIDELLNEFGSSEKNAMQLDFLDFVNMMETHYHKLAHHLFHNSDVDKDGYLSTKEFFNFVSYITDYKDLTIDEIEPLIKKYRKADIKGLNLDEFIHFICRSRYKNIREMKIRSNNKFPTNKH
ncbi:uncharacterized protein LOC126908872 isoform X2 [Daktulosphaira vitifoliae]|uniref:uncharacterized protein LOC126908872 isoform X2 n=1 Tax=Daktulosphaira vitifoliae TaxID=58002 RepID=UPI0021AA3B49|nr:uncharacterized protein LOC126908872 isoform X2 [Daktulosphaira vitifoliae]